MKKERLLGNLMLLITAVIWGTAFVSQRVGMEHVGPFTFMATRYFLAAISVGILAGVTFYFKKSNSDEYSSAEKREMYRMTWISSLVMGIILFLGSSFQQVGLVYTTAGKAGFITTLYIVLVPVISFFLGKKSSKLVIFSVFLAMVGLYLLTIKGKFVMGYGDSIVFISSFIWALQIIMVDIFSKKVEPIYMCFFQFVVCAIFCTIVMFVVEKPTWESIWLAKGSIFYAGVLSAGVGFTLQSMAQKYTDPTVASLILSVEAAFSAIAGYYFLQEILTSKELIGCVLLFFATILAQIPAKTNQKDTTNDEFISEEIVS